MLGHIHQLIFIEKSLIKAMTSYKMKEKPEEMQNESR